MDEVDSDEVVCVFNMLLIIENMIEVKFVVVEFVCERIKFLRWILNRIKLWEFDSNKFYVSEILVILL